VGALGNPPEFGSGGEWPPVRSASVEIARWDLGRSVLDVLEYRPRSMQLRIPELPEDRIVAAVGTATAFLAEPLGAAAKRRARVVAAGMDGLRNHTFKGPDKKLRKRLAALGYSEMDSVTLSGWTTTAIYSQLWERDDPVTQLPPGASTEVSVALKLGLTEERAQEVTESLGLRVGLGKSALTSLSRDLSEKSNYKVSLTAEKQVTKRQTLTSAKDGYYRRVAIWYVVNGLAVMAIPPVGKEEWPPFALEFTEFTVSDSLMQTEVDVPMPALM
jgi:hypothetical protein